MAFPPRFLDEIRNRLSLAEAIGRRVKLTRRGREFVGLCPFHHEKSPSFTVVEEKNFYHCFGCGAHGDVIGFTMRTEGLPFPEAVEKLAAEAGLALPERDPRAEEHARIAKTLYDANEAAAEWFAAQLYTPEGRVALEYLKRRKLEDRTIGRFRLGYAPNARDALKRTLLSKGFEQTQLIDAGLLIKPDDGRSPYDRFRGRVMFPILDKRGRVIAFGGRVLSDDEKPKYLNSPDSSLFHKGQVLYAFREARTAAQGGPDRPSSDIIVAEGYMDVIALHQAGFEGAVAPLGTALTEAQIEELWRLQAEPLLCFDGDEAGRKAAARAAERVLPILKPGKSLRFSFLPEGEDPDSVIKRAGPTAMKTLLKGAMSLVDYVWEIETAKKDFSTPERRADLWKRLYQHVTQVADREVQRHYYSILRAKYFDHFTYQRRLKEQEKSKKFFPLGKVTPEILDTRRCQVILSMLIRSPELIDDYFDRLHSFILPFDEFERLKINILSFYHAHAVMEEHFSFAELENYLHKNSALETYRAMKAEDGRLAVHLGFMSRISEYADVKASFDEIISLVEREMLRKKIEETALAGLADDSPRLARLLKDFSRQLEEVDRLVSRNLERTRTSADGHRRGKLN